MNFITVVEKVIGINKKKNQLFLLKKEYLVITDVKEHVWLPNVKIFVTCFTLMGISIALRYTCLTKM